MKIEYRKGGLSSSEKRKRTEKSHSQQDDFDLLRQANAGVKARMAEQLIALGLSKAAADRVLNRVLHTK